MRLWEAIWSCQAGPRGGPCQAEMIGGHRQLKRGLFIRGWEADFCLQMELLKNEMKIRVRRGARDPHRNSNQK